MKLVRSLLLPMTVLALGAFVAVVANAFGIPLVAAVMLWLAVVIPAEVYLYPFDRKRADA
jgi:heme exporter protein D